MTLYLGKRTPFICPRCHFKKDYRDQAIDPNTKQVMCSSCVDQLDPYRLPARKTEKISLRNPRPESPLVPQENGLISTESGVPIDFPPEIST